MSYWDNRPFTATEEVLRSSWRTRLLDEAKAEKAGESSANVAWVSYDRETAANGVRITTKRPARFNWGVDFTYHLTGIPGRKDEWRPSLKTVFGDVGVKVAASPTHSPLLFEAIDAVFRCREPDDVIADPHFRPILDIKAGFPVDALLKLLKWVFLEQGLTYWHTSGRRKPMEGIRREFENASESENGT